MKTVTSSDKGQLASQLLASPSTLPKASQCAPGLVSSSGLYYYSPSFPSSSRPLATPPGLHSAYSREPAATSRTQVPNYSYLPSSVAPYERFERPALTSTHGFEGPYNYQTNISSAMPSYSPFHSAYGNVNSRPGPCPYPMPKVVDYGCADSVVTPQYRYYGQDNYGPSPASPLVNYMSQPAGVRQGPSFQSASPAAYPRRAFQSQPPATRRKSLSSLLSSCMNLGAPPTGNEIKVGTNRKTVQKRVNRDLSIYDLFPCISDWFGDSESDKPGFGSSSFSASSKKEAGFFGETCGDDADEYEPRRSPAGWKSSAYNPSPVNEYSSYGEEQALRRLRAISEMGPTVDTMCIKCGEILKSNPLDVDDERVRRVLETEAVGRGLRAIKNKDFETHSLQGDEDDDRVPLPSIKYSPVVRPKKTPPKKRYLPANLYLDSEPIYIPEAYPTDADGKVALPAFALGS